MRKHLLYSLIILSVIFFSSCEPPKVYFKNVQPEGAKSFHEFPQKLQGEYRPEHEAEVITALNNHMLFEDEDARILVNNNRIIIDKNSMVNHMDVVFEIDVRQLYAEGLEVDPETLMDSMVTDYPGTKNREVKLISFKDSIAAYSVKYNRPLAHLDKKNVVTKYKKRYYLNVYTKNKGWQVFELNAKRKKLCIGSINSSSLKKLNKTFKQKSGNKEFDINQQDFRKHLYKTAFEKQLKLYKVKK